MSASPRSRTIKNLVPMTERTLWLLSIAVVQPPMSPKRPVHVNVEGGQSPGQIGLAIGAAAGHQPVLHHEQGHDRSTQGSSLVGRGLKSRVVSQAEVATKPDHDGGRWSSHAAARQSNSGDLADPDRPEPAVEMGLHRLGCEGRHLIS